MAKKSKQKQNQQTPNDDSKSSDIFNTLFGGNTADSGTGSIFSDDNPFRRKPEATQELGVGVIEASVEKHNDGASGHNGSDSIELGKRKKKEKKEKKAILDSESVGKEASEDLESNAGVLDTGVLKKRRNLGSESKELMETVGEDGGEVGKSVEKGKKKKRKRDEVEAEYETKRYGVVAAVEQTTEKKVGESVVGEKRKKMDNPEDMMVSNEGFDDEGKLLRTVFVGNLPIKLKKKALMKEFGTFGEVESVRIRSIPIADSTTPRKAAILKKNLNQNADSVHAYIVFKSEESAQASLAHNMALVGGRHIRVDRACPPRKKMKGEDNALYDNKRTVFVGNLPFDVKDEEIYQLFSGIKDLATSIEAIRVIRDPNTLLGKGIAYVLFKTREAANTISKKRNLKLRDRELRVFHSKSSSTPSKRKSLSTENRFSSPAKRFAGDSASRGSSNKVIANTTTSYQGTRATKSGVVKQARISNRGKVVQQRSQPSERPKERKSKRPAVAARKTKELKAAAAGMKQQTGTKRKLENRTPDSSNRKKKFRKS